MIILFINCRLYPFIDWIISGLKLYETRNRNTLKNLIGKRVYIAETGKHKRPIVRCTAIIDHVIKTDMEAFDSLRKQTMINPGSAFDWTKETKQKYLYRLTDIVQIEPFTIPDNAIYHGRVYATTN